MPTSVSNLYETLGVSKDASAEEIRKAYKKRALQTHPDRLPQGATPEDKAASEEQFRKVNNAYEVLNNAQNRKIYDQYGVWPPPDPSEQRPRRHSHSRYDPYSSRRHNSMPGYVDPFSHPFFNRSNVFGFGAHPFSRPHPHDFMFTDPFQLFNSIFGDFGRHFDDLDDDPFIPPGFMPHGFPRGSPFGHEQGAFPFGGFSTGFSGPPFHAESRGLHSFGSSSRGGRWVSESRVTKTVNGMTESVWTRRDADGNEHITRTYPDGRERYTINGVEQPGRLDQPQSSNSRYIPPPPPYPGLSSQQASQPVIPPRQDYEYAPVPPRQDYVPQPRQDYSQPSLRQDYAQDPSRKDYAQPAARDYMSGTQPHMYNNNHGERHHKHRFRLSKSEKRDKGDRKHGADESGRADSVYPDPTIAYNGHHDAKKKWWRPNW